MKDNNYPKWICDDCGIKYGKWHSKGHYTGPTHWSPTYHFGNCDICKAENTPVTEPRDYGGLRRPLTYLMAKNNDLK